MAPERPCPTYRAAARTLTPPLQQDDQTKKKDENLLDEASTQHFYPTIHNAVRSYKKEAGLD